MDEVRIQIVNYKTKNYLLGCLDSLANDLKNFGGRYSIAILDNASGEDLSDLPGLFPENNISVFHGGKNLGFGGGHNFLSAKGEADFLLLLNPDIKIIEPNTVQRLIDCAVFSKADVVGPRLITKNGSAQKWDHGELHGLIAQLAMNFGTDYWRKRKDIIEAAWVSGAVFLIKKEKFSELRGFDENFFLYQEENDLCLRLRGKGGKIIYDPTISVLHYGGVVAKKSDWLKKSKDYFLDKHFRNRFGYRLLKLINNFR